ncbi:CHAT domain-containing protein [Spirosoma sp. KNUC1025]|uniref:CHAT domain-containing protein n=1 Tax=Spirosoma sp. KNUC1025 TaxID=2894082 RepID=UPI003863763B|nr:CHAT domain-containing protein [Spirosoma sp. KNUC1025]
MYAKLMHVLGRTYWQEGNFQMGQLYTNQAIAINQRQTSFANKPNLVNSYYNSGRIYADQNLYKEALSAYEQCVRLSSLYPVKRMWGSKALSQKSYILYLLGDYEAAVREADLGVRMAQQANNKLVVTENLCSKAQALIRLGELKAAKDDLTQALTLINVVDNPNDVADVYSLLGSVANDMHNYEDVAGYYQKAFAIYRQINFRYGCVQTLSTLGEFYEKTIRQYGQALSMYKQALTYSDDATSRMVVLNDIGRVYSRQNQFALAISFYKQALKIVGLDMPDQQTATQPIVGKMQATFGKEYLLTLLQDKADTWLAYAKATNNHQRFQYALNTYKLADQMIDFMRWEHTGNSSKLYWREKTRGIYKQAIETCLQLKDTEQAFRFFEKSRAAMLADKLNELGARQQLSPQQAKEEQRLQQAVSSLQAQLAETTTSKGMDSLVFRKAQQALDKEQTNLDEFRKRLELSNQAYFRYRYDTTITSLADLRDHLKRQRASFVTYFVGDSLVYVLGVTADTARLYVKPVNAYQKNIQAFLGLLANPDAMNRKPNRDLFLTLGNGLYNQLLAPLKLPAGRVIVSPDGSFVPFETLSRTPETADYLVQDYAFSYTYSARLLLKTYTEHKAGTSVRQGRFLGIAPVEFDPSLKQVSLPGSDDALKRIAEQFQSPILLTHRNATRRAFLSKAADASVIQLFTHATADSSGQEPRLFFADSALQISDLGDGDLPHVQLVVLAACKTGVGAVQQGEGVFSLARGFAAQGVPSVLTTLWSVQNLATYELTELFYKYVDEGLPKDIALQRAKQDWLKSANQTNQMPNFWAGLIIVGDTEPLDRINYALWVTVVSLLAFGIAGVWFWQKKRVTKSSVSLPHSV